MLLPVVYPMSTTWIDGRMPSHEWKEFHAGEYREKGEDEIIDPAGESPGQESRKSGTH
jgi:hypothetical protein